MRTWRRSEKAESTRLSGVSWVSAQEKDGRYQDQTTRVWLEQSGAPAADAAAEALQAGDDLKTEMRPSPSGGASMSEVAGGPLAEQLGRSCLPGRIAWYEMSVEWAWGQAEGEALAEGPGQDTGWAPEMRAYYARRHGG